MCLQGVAFLISGAIVYTTFLRSCGRGYGLEATTYVRTFVSGKQGYARCILL